MTTRAPRDEPPAPATTTQLMPIDTPDKPAAAHDRDALLARLALQQAPIATMVLDGEHRVTAWNDACAA